MTEGITIHLPRRSRDVFFAKVTIVLLLGAFSGSVYNSSVKSDNAAAESLTLEEYTARFEEYRAEMTQEDWGLFGHMVLATMTFVMFAVVYEGLGKGLGLLLSTLLPAPSRSGSVPLSPAT